ncbi:MAG: hypothetical protein H6708_06985 [Kofleriaceae bacterium]|nr:hypothetical protein [Kofleriaceae bacterium]
MAAVDRATPGWRRAALVALDAAAPVLHLAEHHHLAEEQDLFVHAAATAPALIDELAARWRADLDGARGALDDAIAALAAAP